MATSYGKTKTVNPSPKPTTKKPSPKPAKEPAKEPSLEAVSAIDLEGAQQDYERFLPAAQALDARDIRPFRADAPLAYHNVQKGVDAVLPHEARIEKELPTIDRAALRDLPHLALAVIFAASQVDRGAGNGADVAPRLRRAHELRDLLLTSADALAKAGIVPARAVEKIREGRGAIDAAQDCVDLAALFTKHAAAAKGKTPVSAALVKEAAKVGTELLTVLKPRAARRGPKGSAAAVDAAAVRDRLWSLLLKGHQDLRRAGMWLWVDEVDAHVPPIQSRVASPRKKPEAPKQP